MKHDKTTEIYITHALVSDDDVAALFLRDS